MEDEKAAKLAQEQLDAEARKKKAVEIEAQAKAEQQAAAERAANAATASKKLQDEAHQENLKREAEEKRL